jgi:hypothetical protein
MNKRSRFERRVRGYLDELGGRANASESVGGSTGSASPPSAAPGGFNPVRPKGNDSAAGMGGVSNPGGGVLLGRLDQ